MRVDSLNKAQDLSFTSLRKVKCAHSGAWRGCSYNEARIINELENIAINQPFFKKYDVKAKVNVARNFGSELRLDYKPVANSFLENVRQFFKAPKSLYITDSHYCPDDSSYFLLKKLRDMDKDGKFRDL